MPIARSRGYRLLMGASAASNLGDGVLALALPWLATAITRDPVLIAAVAAATRLPWLLVSIPAGVVTDRADRRRLIWRADLVRCALAVAVMALVLGARPPLPDDAPGALPAIAALCALAFLTGCAEVMRDNAAQTMLPAVVAPHELERANGQLWSVERIASAFVGPPLAGLLIARGLPLPFALDAASLALAAWLVWLMVLPPHVPAPRRAFLAEMGEGLAWLWAHAMLLRAGLVLGAINACSVGVLTLMVLIAREGMGLGPAGYGLVLAAGAGGAVAGGVVAPVVAERLGGHAAMLAGMGCLVLAYALVWAAAAPWMLGAALALEAVGAMLWNVVTVSWRQRAIPAAILGRVNAIYRCLGWGAMPLGALAAGAAAALLEPALGREDALRAVPLAASLILAGLAAFVAARVRPTKA